jgi:hypothetical protein
MRKLMLGTVLGVALGPLLGADIVSAKAGDPPGERSCRLAGAAPALKLLRPSVLVENGLSLPAGRVSRRVNYTSVPSATSAREQDSYLVLLDRQSKPTSLMVGVGF